jgi:hypothetical protein
MVAGHSNPMEAIMFTTLAQTFFRASGVAVPRYRNDLSRPRHRDNVRAATDHKRWEDWK